MKDYTDQVVEKVVKEIITSSDAHMKKHGIRKMSMAKLMKVTDASC